MKEDNKKITTKKAVIKPRTKKEKELMVTENISYKDAVLYTGDNSESFINSFKDLSKNGLTFNIFAALVGPLYFMYRKMYLSSLLFILLSMTAVGNPIVQILLMILMGISSNFIYFNKMKYDIKRINEKYKDDEELRKEFLKQAGGINMALPTVCGAIIILSISFLWFMLLAYFI